MALTAARVDMTIDNNATWNDAFQFGTTGDTTWSFSNKTFLMDVKGSADETAPLLALSSTQGTIVVDDVVQRILHLEVDRSVILASLPISNDDEPYVYDLVMVDSVTSERTVLMEGKVCVRQGVTQE